MLVGEQDQWVTRIRSDDASVAEAAMGELRELLVRTLTKSFAGSTGSQLPVEDVAQNSLIKIVSSIDQFQGKSKFTTWAISIAIREGVTELRRKHYRDVTLDPVNVDRVLTASAASRNLEDEEESQKRKGVLQTLFGLIEDTLTDKQRQAIQGTQKGLPVAEIARRMGSNRNATYKLIHDARKRLKAGLENAGYSAEQIQSLFGA